MLTIGRCYKNKDGAISHSFMPGLLQLSGKMSRNIAPENLHLWCFVFVLTGKRDVQWWGLYHGQLTVYGTRLLLGWNVSANNETLNWWNVPLLIKHQRCKNSQRCQLQIPESIAIRNVQSESFNLWSCSRQQLQSFSRFKKNFDFPGVDGQWLLRLLGIAVFRDIQCTQRTALRFSFFALFLVKTRDYIGYCFCKADVFYLFCVCACDRYYWLTSS